MFSEMVDFAMKQLSEMGMAGFIVGGLATAVYKVWKELQAERRRCEDLVEKLQDLSRETLTMIERITSR